MSAAGKWNISMDTPIGTQKFTWDLQQTAADWQGTMQGPTGAAELKNIKVNGSQVAFDTRVNGPMGAINLSFNGAVQGDQISGTCKTMFGNVQFTGQRA